METPMESSRKHIRSFRELRVWQKSMDLAMEIFQLSKRFPNDERFSLTDQIRRPSRSVPANIAEAWRKRRYPGAFVSKINDSEGEAAETQTHLEFARRCQYIDESTVQRLDSEYEQVLGMLVTMASQPAKWTVVTDVAQTKPFRRTVNSMRQNRPGYDGAQA